MQRQRYAVILGGLALMGLMLIESACAEIRLNGRTVGQGEQDAAGRASVQTLQPLPEGQGMQYFLKQWCQQRHQPAADVAHQPDASIHYAGAVPATIDPTQVIIPLNIPLSRYLRNPSAYHLDGTETQLNTGTLSFDAQGQLLLNGQPTQLSDEEYQRLCVQQ